MATTFRAGVTDIDWCGDDVIVLRLERPSQYSFTAGQWMRLTLETPEGPATRTLSHASAPGDNWIEIATRLSNSDFKLALAGVDVGDELAVSSPGGRPMLPRGGRAVFLAGGVGVTPVRSLLRDVRHEGRRYEDALVVLANRDGSCELYADEIESMGDLGVRVVRVRERAGDEWPGERGFISAEVLRRHLDRVAESNYFISGPPPMVAAVESVLESLGISRDRWSVESFAGS